MERTIEAGPIAPYTGGAWTQRILGTHLSIPAEPIRHKNPEPILEPTGQEISASAREVEESLGLDWLSPRLLESFGSGKAAELSGSLYDRPGSDCGRYAAIFLPQLYRPYICHTCGGENLLERYVTGFADCLSCAEKVEAAKRRPLERVESPHHKAAILSLPTLAGTWLQIGMRPKTVEDVHAEQKEAYSRRKRTRVRKDGAKVYRRPGFTPRPYAGGQVTVKRG